MKIKISKEWDENINLLLVPENEAENWQLNGILKQANKDSVKYTTWEDNDEKGAIIFMNNHEQKN